MLSSPLRIVYHGPREDVMPFYVNLLGYKCSMRKDPASFLVEICSKEGQERLCKVLL